MYNSYQFLVNLISEHTGIDEKEFTLKSSPQDFPAWDSLANIQIFIALQENDSSLLMTNYLECSTIEDICKIIEGNFN